MTEGKPSAEAILDQLPQDQRDAGMQRRAPAPVHLWNPPFSGEIDIRIARDGTWYHEGGPITRLALAQLFSGILRLDPDGRYYLVTPVECWGIQVDDAPFVVVSMACSGSGREQTLRMTTNLEDSIEVGPDHPLRVVVDQATGEPAPYVLIRSNLEALINRSVFYELADLAVEHEVGGVSRLGVWSQGEFFPIDGFVD
jgi:uncharacterized protein